jgi:hypothetical protein
MLRDEERKNASNSQQQVGLVLTVQLNDTNLQSSKKHSHQMNHNLPCFNSTFTFLLQQRSSTMSSPFPLVWFFLLDSAIGEPYKDTTTADYVSLPPGTVIAQFRAAVKKKDKDDGCLNLEVKVDKDVEINYEELNIRIND